VVPATSGRSLINVKVELKAVSPTAFQRTYVNLPPIPVLADSDSQLADPLTYNVPLRRLYTGGAVQLLVDGSADGDLAPLPWLLKVGVPAEAPKVAGVSYLRSGAIMNDPIPSTATQPVLDNWPGDPTWPTPPDWEYYGSLIQFVDGSIAYSNGRMFQEDRSTRNWADYVFIEEDQWPQLKIGQNKLADRGGRSIHGTLATVKEGTGTTPEWTAIGYLHDALSFDGISSAVDFPVSAYPAGPVTAELLVRPRELGRVQTILSQGGDVCGVTLRPDGTLSVSRLNENRQYDVAVGTTALPVNEWASIVVTFDGTSLRLVCEREARCRGRNARVTQH